MLMKYWIVYLRFINVIKEDWDEIYFILFVFSFKYSRFSGISIL